MKYDDASWHYGGGLPDELPPEAGATHIGMFVAWAMLNGLGSDEVYTDCGDLVENLNARKSTPGDWFIRVFDEKFTDEDLSEEGNAFAASYYCLPDGSLGAYVDDYGEVFEGIDDIYFVADTWDSYDRLAPVILRRFATWKQQKSPWWKRLWK